MWGRASKVGFFSFMYWLSMIFLLGNITEPILKYFLAGKGAVLSELYPRFFVQSITAQLLFCSANFSTANWAVIG